MARLFTSSFETASFTDWTAIDVGSPVRGSTVVLDGAFSMEVPGAEAVVRRTVTVSLGNFLYSRVYIYLPGNPGSNSFMPLQHRTGTGTVQYGVFIDTSRVPKLNYNGTVIGSGGAALATNAWHLIELGSKIGSGASDDSAELRVNLATIASETNATRSTTAQGRVYVGGQNTPPTGTTYLDAFACNDSTGAAPDNTWLGPLKRSPGRRAPRQGIMIPPSRGMYL